MEKPNKIKGLTDLCPIFLRPFLCGKFVFRLGVMKFQAYKYEKTRRNLYERSYKFIEFKRRYR